MIENMLSTVVPDCAIDFGYITKEQKHGVAQIQSAGQIVEIIHHITSVCNMS